MPETKAEPKPTNRFAAWIDEIGAPMLARQLGVTKRVVYAWRSKAIGGPGYRPRPDKLAEILQLAQGRLSTPDIFPPRVAKAKGRR